MASIVCISSPSSLKAESPKAGRTDSAGDPAEISLEQLLTLRITSVSKHEQKVSDAAAAIYVITQDDIARSGVTSVAEALRMVPGLFVGRLDSHTWAIGSRGFVNVFSNKLLVLMDGRSIYTPTFAAVFWDVQDTVLEDIERIEVIRGPGATLWGANAVNGVINIITKSARETTGGLVSAGGGTEELGFGQFRYGMKLGKDVSARVYGKYFSRDSSVLPNGAEAMDSWDKAQGGFRLDWDASNADEITFQGDFYGGTESQYVQQPSVLPPYFQDQTGDTKVSGGNLLTRWTHTFSDTSDLSLQLYYAREVRDQPSYREDLDTYDADFQHRFELGSRQEILWGMGARRNSDNFPRMSLLTSLQTPKEELNQYNLFVQDEITLVEDRLKLALGTKLEHNEFTGLEVQPGGRLLWSPSKQQTIWGSIARAVRTPSRIEKSAFGTFAVVPPQPPFPPVFPGSPTTLIRAVGGAEYGSESLIAYELGYRAQLLDKLSLDVAGFYNDYDNLRTLEPAGLDLSNMPAFAVQQFAFGNQRHGTVYGGEAAANWDVMPGWRLRPSYSLTLAHTQNGPGSQNKATEFSDRGIPQQQVSLRSSMDLPQHLFLDIWARWVDQVSLPRTVTVVNPIMPAGDVDIPSYFSLDVRLAWRPTKNLEFSVVGQNLLDNHRPENAWEVFSPRVAEIERGVYGKVSYSF